MYEINININSANNMLEIRTLDKIIGSQHDNKSAKLKWNVPEKYLGYVTKLIFRSNKKSFEPIYTTYKEFMIVSSLTEDRVLFFELAFVDKQKQEIAHSNILEFKLRESLIPGNDPIGTDPPVFQGVEEAPINGDLYGRMDGMWVKITAENIGLEEISNEEIDEVVVSVMEKE